MVDSWGQCTQNSTATFAAFNQGSVYVGDGSNSMLMARESVELTLTTQPLGIDVAWTGDAPFGSLHGHEIRDFRNQEWLLAKGHPG